MQFHSHVLRSSVYTPKKNNTSSMNSSLPSFGAVTTPLHKYKNVHRSMLHVRAQSYNDEGRSNNIVDGNLRILKERIEEVRNKEMLERCIASTSDEEQGWNYATGYDHKYQKEMMLAQLLELVGLIGGRVGLTICGGSFLLCVISLILHLNQSV